MLVIAAAEAVPGGAPGERPAAAAPRRARRGVAAPAVYYALLERTDAAWELAGQVNAAGNQADVELALVGDRAHARAARRCRPRSPTGCPARQLAGGGRARVAVRRAGGLPAPIGTFPYHAFQGMAIPLSVLAVQGVRRVWAAPAGRWVVGGRWR